MNIKKNSMVRSLVVSAAVAALCTLTACGDDGSSASPEEPSSSAVEISSSSVSSSSQEKYSSSVEATPVESSSSKLVESSSSVEEAPAMLTDARDGQTYKTVKIGTQIWMAENLKFNSNFLPEDAADSVYNSFCYGDDDANCEKMGRLYLWSAAMDSAAVYSSDGAGCGYYEECEAKEVVRGICPEGWHFPTYAEWNTLFTAAGGDNYAGRELKATTGWSQNGKDTYGFGVIPTGRRNSYGSYDDETTGYFWVPDVQDKSSANAWAFTYATFVSKDHFFEDNALAVRCVMNAE